MILNKLFFNKIYLNNLYIMLYCRQYLSHLQPLLDDKKRLQSFLIEEDLPELPSSESAWHVEPPAQNQEKLKVERDDFTSTPDGAVVGEQFCQRLHSYFNCMLDCLDVFQSLEMNR